MSPRLRLVSPEPEKRTVRPAGRPPNRELRTREHLTPAEVERIIEAAKGNRQGQGPDHDPARVQAWSTCCRTG
jgi:hypothetical protein